jgi:hypothetical protein
VSDVSAVFFNPYDYAMHDDLDRDTERIHSVSVRGFARLPMLAQAR